MKGVERLFRDAPILPESRLWLWRLLFPPIRALVFLFVRVEVRGREHLPPSGAYMIAANHTDWKDPPAVSLALGIPVRWMAKSEVFRWPVIGFLLRGVGNFGIRRGESDRRALELSMRVLQHGLPLGVFPEGHRSEHGALLRGRAGIALLAERSAAPIVPCAIVGTRTAMPHIPRRTEIVLTFGPAFRFTDLPEDVRRDRQATADAIMRRIAELLPYEMRGVYAE